MNFMTNIVKISDFYLYESFDFEFIKIRLVF
jgi:hypothetical protein